MSYINDVINGNYKSETTYNSDKKKKKSYIESVLDGTYNSAGFYKKDDRNSNSKQSSKELSGKILKKSKEMEDGYQFGDITRSFLGTANDLITNTSKGLLSPVESILDIGTNIIATGQDLLGFDEAAKNTRDFAQKDLVDNAVKIVGNVNPIGIAYNIVNGTPQKIFNPAEIEIDKDKNIIENYKEGFQKAWLNESEEQEYQKSSVSGEYVNKTVELIGHTLGLKLGGEMLGGKTVRVGSDKLGASISKGNIGFNLAGHELNLPTLAVAGGMAGGLKEANAKENINEAERWSKAFSGGIIEGFTEGIFGMLGVGGNDITEKLASKAANQFSSKAGKMLAQIGISASGEAAEEFLSYAGNFLVDNGIIDKLGKADFKTEWNWGEVGEQMALAFVSSALTSGASTKIGSNSAIEAAEKQLGRKLNNAEKSQVTQAMIDGTIQEKIDELNGYTENETKVYNSLMDEKLNTRKAEIAKENEYNAKLEEQQNILARDLTEQEKIQLKKEIDERFEDKEVSLEDIELNEDEMKQFDKSIREEIENGNLSEEKIRDILGENVDISNDRRLQNSYIQSKNKRTVYNYQKTSSVAKNAVMESAVNANMNNTEMSRNFIDYVSKISEDTGVAYRFANTNQLKKLGYTIDNKVVDGVVAKDGTVYINPQSKDAINYVLGHETTHLLENTQEYEKLQKMITNYAQQKGIYEEALENIKSRYSNILENDEDFTKELTSDLSSRLLFSDETFIQELSVKEPNIFQKFYNFIKHTLKMATVGSKEAKQLEKIKYSFDKAYKSLNSKSIKNKAQYHVSKNLSNDIDIVLNNINERNPVRLRDYTPSVLVSNGIKDLPMYENPSHIRKNILTDSEAQKLGLTINSKDHYHGLGKETYIKAIDSLDDPRVIFKNRNNSQDYLILTVVKDSQNNSVVVPIEVETETYTNNIKIDINRIKTVFGYDRTNPNLDEYIKYNIKNNNLEKIYEKKKPSTNITSQSASTNSIPSTNTDVNTTNKYSIQESENNTGSFNLSNKDSQGKLLSKEQQEYFKDSKARDENGRLKTVYHGTPYDFNIFNYSKLGENTSSLGAGFYFTDQEQTGKEYTRENGNLKTVYLNIERPMSYGKTTMTKGEYRDFIQEIDKATNGGYLTDYDGIDNALMEYDYGGDDIDLVNAVHNASGLSWEKVYSILRKTTGFDGVISPKGFLNKGETIYLAFNSNQIKNIDNTNPTDNPDIRYSVQNNKSNSNIFDKIIPEGNNYKVTEEDVKVEENASLNNTDIPIVENGEIKGSKETKLRGKAVQYANRAKNRFIRQFTQDMKINENINKQLILDVLNQVEQEISESGKLSKQRSNEIFDYMYSNLLIEDGKYYTDTVNSEFEVLDKENFDRNLDPLIKELKLADRYNKEEIKNNTTINDVGTLNEAYKQLAIKQKEYDKAMNKELLTQRDKAQIDRLINQEITVNELPNDVNKEGILNIYNIKKDLAELKRDTQNYRKNVVSKNRDLAKSMTKNILQWRDKSAGWKYQTNTMKRNIFDIIPNKVEAQAVYDTYFRTITKNNAQIEKSINSYNDRIDDLNINNEESTYIQMLGESKYNPESKLPVSMVEDFYNKHKKKIDVEKCNQAVEEFRAIYDELIEKINNTLLENGYKPVEYREGYFPHFIEDKAETIIGKLAEKMGWKIKKDTLPTDIAGITDTFKPGKSWTSFSQQRTGDATDYNVLKGFDNYIRGAMDVIYHTEDIQKLRALENEIRYQYSNDGIKEQIDNIYANNELDTQEKEIQIGNLLDNIKNAPMGNLVTELKNYTNNLANKKATSDRGMEEFWGRQTYSIMSNVQNRVSANMVGANISSAMTNFIPITQAWSQTSTKNIMRGIKESIATCFKNDGFADSSTFLTNRTQNADRLYKTGLDSINDKLGFMFEKVDEFTSNTIVRAKYYDNIEKGMSTQEAMDNADEFAKDVMAGRSKGDMPTAFNKKNPLIKLFSAFQLEVNNQYGYMFKDIPRDLADEGKGKLIGAFIKMFLGAFLYNKLSEEITGRKSAFSPIDLALDSYKTATNEKMDAGEKIKSITEDIAGELPFVSGVVGGGRLPIQAALPDASEMISSASDLFDINVKDKSKAIKSLTQEISKPLYYVALPFAGGQLKKTVEGLSMYNSDLPVAGSYTNSGKLRYTVSDDLGSKIKAGVFGQYSVKEAQEYFEEGYSPLTEKQTQELVDLDIPISDYRKYKDKLKEIDKIKAKDLSDDTSKLQMKLDYISSLDLSNKQKNILANNATTRKEKIDVKKYEEYNNLEEMDYAIKNPSTYKTIKTITDFNTYNKYKEEIADIKEKYSSDSQKKRAVVDYINELPLDVGQKAVMIKLNYTGIKDNNAIIVDYINNLDIDYDDRIEILEKLGFKYKGGRIYE